jgi:hypothetical protein
MMHRSATQKTVTQLSCEAELNAAVLCIQDMIYTKNLLELVECPKLEASKVLIL